MFTFFIILQTLTIFSPHSFIHSILMMVNKNKLLQNWSGSQSSVRSLTKKMNELMYICVKTYCLRFSLSLFRIIANKFSFSFSYPKGYHRSSLHTHTKHTTQQHQTNKIPLKCLCLFIYFLLLLLMLLKKTKILQGLIFKHFHFLSFFRLRLFLFFLSFRSI